MKRRVIAMLLVVVMAMSGCAKEAKDKSGSVVEAGQTKDMNEQSGVAASLPAGGKPWINSDLKENLPENNSGSMELSAKDDFHLYVNYEWLKNAQIPAGMESEGAPYGFAIMNKANQELLDMFNAGLKNIKANGKYQAILDKYLK